MGETTLTEYKNDHGVRAIAVNREAEDTLKALNENTLTEYSDSSVTNIRDYLFYNNTALQSASFPNATAAGASVFQGCSGLTEIDLPNLTTMGGYIGTAENVTSINLPKLLATPNWGLSGLTNITRIDLPSLTDCGDNTFRNLRKLEVVTMMSVTVIRGTAFLTTPKCATIVLGADTVCTLSNINGLPPRFGANGAGGTLWVKRALIEEYKSATNWSVILAYPNNQILAIEDMNNT